MNTLNIAKNTGANTTQSGFPNTGLPPMHFYFITINQVIEHVHNSLVALRETFRILKPGRNIWLATPNLESFSHVRFHSSWRGLEPPRHLTFFTHKSLKRALTNSMYETVEKKLCAPEATWFYTSSLRISRNQDPNDPNSNTLPLILLLTVSLKNCKSVINPKPVRNHFHRRKTAEK